MEQDVNNRTKPHFPSHLHLGTTIFILHSTLLLRARTNFLLLRAIQKREIFLAMIMYRTSTL